MKENDKELLDFDEEQDLGLRAKILLLCLLKLLIGTIMFDYFRMIFKLMQKMMMVKELMMIDSAAHSWLILGLKQSVPSPN